MPSLVWSKVCAAVLPTVKITLGLRKLSWRSMNGQQVACSFLVGVRFFGGRQRTTLVMVSESLGIPNSSVTMRRSSVPDRPTKGTPVSSSLAPGASPTINRPLLPSPMPMTGCTLVACSPQAVQVLISAMSSAGAGMALVIFSSLGATWHPSTDGAQDFVVDGPEQTGPFINGDLLSRLCPKEHDFLADLDLIGSAVNDNLVHGH